jgi:hypothetical protein
MLVWHATLERCIGLKILTLGRVYSAWKRVSWDKRVQKNWFEEFSPQAVVDFLGKENSKVGFVIQVYVSHKLGCVPQHGVVPQLEVDLQLGVDPQMSILQ